MIVRATKRDPITINVTEVGRLRIYLPDLPGRNIRGRKANIRVAVQPITAALICFVALIAASNGFVPPLTHLEIFSTTTIESSTSRPRAITAPTILSWFMLNPIKYKPVSPISIDNGIDITTIPEALNPRGSNVSRTIRKAKRKSFSSRLSLFFTFCDWSNPLSSLIPEGRVFSKESYTLYILFRTACIFCPFFIVAMRKTPFSPLYLP